MTGFGPDDTFAAPVTLVASSTLPVLLSLRSRQLLTYCTPTTGGYR